jgi:prolyl-tRNA editing enzyme YbaK/EbsC (Cys-tRNA(Pro) deacylase)
MQPLTPDDVQKALNDLKLNITIHTFDESTATAQLAADAIGCELGQIVKSLCFIINGEKPIIVLTSGDQLVDDRKIAALFNIGRKKVRMARADECLAIYGYPPGGVPPVGHRTPNLPIYVDTTLKRYETVYAAAGTANTIFPIGLAQLVTATGGAYADVVR